MSEQSVGRQAGPYRPWGRFDAVKLPSVLAMLVLAVWGSWGRWGEGPFLRTPGLWLFSGVLAWVVAIFVTSLLDKKTSGPKWPERQTDGETNMFAVAGPRLRASGKILFGAWMTLNTLSTVIAVVETRETGRILAITPVMVFAAILLVLAGYRNVRQVVTGVDRRRLEPVARNGE